MKCKFLNLISMLLVALMSITNITVPVFAEGRNSVSIIKEADYEYNDKDNKVGDYNLTSKFSLNVGGVTYYGFCIDPGKSFDATVGQSLSYEPTSTDQLPGYEELKKVLYFGADAYNHKISPAGNFLRASTLKNIENDKLGRKAFIYTHITAGKAAEKSRSNNVWDYGITSDNEESKASRQIVDNFYQEAISFKFPEQFHIENLYSVEYSGDYQMLKFDIVYPNNSAAYELIIDNLPNKVEIESLTGGKKSDTNKNIITPVGKDTQRITVSLKAPKDYNKTEDLKIKAVDTMLPGDIKIYKPYRAEEPLKSTVGQRIAFLTVKNVQEQTVTAQFKGKTDIEVRKIWEDQNNNDKHRPQSLEVKLLQNEQAMGDSLILTADNDWKGMWKDLPKSDKNGIPYRYSVQELNLPDGYYWESTKKDDSKDSIIFFTLTNRYDIDKTSVAVNKIWDDNNDQDGYRPDKIQVNLLADGEKTDQSAELNESNNWSHIFSGLTKYKTNEYGEKVLIQYSVKEVVEGAGTEWTEYYNDPVIRQDYVCEPGQDNCATNCFTLINTRQTDQVTVSGTKFWNDNENQDSKKPDSITLRLYANGKYVDSVLITAADGWKYEFKDLPKKQNNEIIQYTVLEESVEGYTAQYHYNYYGEDEDDTHTINITNTHNPDKTSIAVSKVWEDNNNQDEKRPDSVTVVLQRKINGEYQDVDKNGAVSGTPYTITLSADSNHWSGSFEDLPKYDNGTEIQYGVREVNLDELKENGYQAYIKEEPDTNSFIITNSRKEDTIAIRGRKFWYDNDNQDGKRPDFIRLQVYNNIDKEPVQTVTVVPKDPSSNEWSFEITGLPRNKDGKPIEYCILEEAVENYKVTYNYIMLISNTDQDDEDTVDILPSDIEININNVYTPGKTSITVKKVWDDNDNQDRNRPESIEVVLYKDGERTDQTVTLNEDNLWQAVFEDLDIMENGEKVLYDVEEETVPGYGKLITGSQETGFIITNKASSETTSVKVEKQWQDDDNAYGVRPSSIQVTLLSNGTPVANKLLTKASDWKAEFDHLPKYDDGIEIAYTVLEEDVNYYDADYMKTESGDWIIQNTYKPTTVNFSVTKQWKDGCHQVASRPGNITVRLLANGVYTGQTLRLNALNGWKGRFTGLDAVADGKVIVYTVEEDPLEGYTSEVTGDVVHGFVITNTSTVCVPDRPGPNPGKPNGDNSNNNDNNNNHNNNNNNSVVVTPGGSNGSGTTNNSGGTSNRVDSTDNPDLPQNRVPDTTIPVDKPNSSVSDNLSTTNRVNNSTTDNSTVRNNTTENNVSTTNRTTTETTDRVALATSAARTSTDTGITKFAALLGASGAALVLLALFKCRKSGRTGK